MNGIKNRKFVQLSLKKMEDLHYKKRNTGIKHKRTLFERMRGFRSMDEHRPGEVITRL